MKILKYIPIVVFMFVTSIGDAQIQSQDFYAFRMNTMFNVNPAYTTSEDGLSLFTGGLAQNKGVNFNTKNIMFGAFSKLSKSQGLGGGVITDSRGAFETTKASLSYAYLVNLNKNSNLSFGISSGILSKAMNSNRIDNFDLLDETDPTLLNTYYNGIQFIAGAGALFHWKELKISASLPHIVATNSSLNTFSHLLASYNFKTKGKFSFEPSFYFHGIPTLRNVFGGQIRTNFNNLFWLQSGYQNNSMFHTGLGFNYENVGIGYGYRVNNSKFATIASGSHEVVISFKISKKKKKVNSNQTLVEIDTRLTNLLNENITPENKKVFIKEIQSIKSLMINTKIDNSTPESISEASSYLKSIESKLIQLQTKINAI
jgi:type IX secretion system PorP/SprF family membrane protein